MNYPDELLRGILNSNFIDEYESPTSDLFYFLENKKKEHPREDGYNELSIDWYDDEAALDRLFNQRKDDGTIHFSSGAAVLIKKEIDRIISITIASEKLTYERQPVEGNKYHGNLLLKAEVPNRVMKKIAASIATICFSKIISNRFSK